MPNDAKGPLQRAEQQAKSAHVFVSIAVIILVLTAAVDVVIPFFRALRGNEIESLSAGVNLIGVGLIAATPIVFFAIALSHLNQALDAYRQGQFFSLRSAGSLREAGVWSVTALIMKIAGAPTLIQWVGQRESGLTFDLDRFDFGVLGLALAIVLIGRVMEAAAAIKADSDQIV
jgi:hypothetical protein